MDGFETGEIGVGVVTGIRRWALDDDGWLRGISYGERWQPGENVAVHGGTGIPPERTPDGGFAAALNGMITAIGGQPTTRSCTALACGDCGYYAYFDHVAQYGQRGITGIIEGYGHVIIGTKGFRAQRARIVALCVAPQPEPREPGVFIFHVGGPGKAPAIGIARMVHNYPDIPIYATEAEMLAAHPTDKGTYVEPPPDPDRPAPWGPMTGYVTFNPVTIRGSRTWTDKNVGQILSDVFAEAVNQANPPLFTITAPVEPEESRLTPRERALAARKSRHTGPPKPRLDGRNR